MSTCRGALPPHHDCPHGDACDWQPPTLGEDIARMLGKGPRPVEPGAYVPNRADRRRAGRGR